MFPSVYFMESGLITRNLFHFEFTFANGVRYGSHFSFTCGYSVFPTPFVEEIFYVPLHILSSFVID